MENLEWRTFKFDYLVKLVPFRVNLERVSLEKMSDLSPRYFLKNDYIFGPMGVFFISTLILKKSSICHFGATKSL